MDGKTEQQRRFLTRFFYYLVLLGIAVFITRYAIKALLPFFVALLAAVCLSPAVRWCTRKLHVHTPLAAVVCTVLLYGVLVLLAVLACVKLIPAAVDLLSQLPALYRSEIQPGLAQAVEQVERFMAENDEAAAATWDMITGNLGTSLSQMLISVSKAAVSFAGNTVVSVPGFLLNALLCVIGTVFFLIDWPYLKGFILQQITEQKHQLLHNIRMHLQKTLGNYLRSYAIIMAITFAEISLGLLLLGFGRRAFLLASLIAVFDILPVVGSGLILAPWGGILLLSGNIRLGISILVLWLVVVIVRNFVEPKVVGQQVGMRPIVTLLSMFVGTFVFGPIGLLALPVALALCKSLNDAKVVQLYKPYAPPKTDARVRRFASLFKKGKSRK